MWNIFQIKLRGKHEIKHPTQNSKTKGQMTLDQNKRTDDLG
jgi:hypothetical protein